MADAKEKIGMKKFLTYALAVAAGYNFAYAVEKAFDKDTVGFTIFIFIGFICLFISVAKGEGK